jgi:beta-galactosidase
MFRLDRLRYGVAYYDEYMPCDRLAQDIELMLAAGINTVRIAESTWSTLEPQSGVFDFSSIDRVLDAMQVAGIDVIIGTPTYAVPTWLVRLHPEVLAITPAGPGQYGARQNMDITCPAYLFHAERVIRALLAHVCDHPAVIGYQADNETKHYNTCGPNVQAQFVTWMQQKFTSLDELNARYGLDYWSNRINAWEDFPSVNGTINGSLKAEFQAFQRQLVTDFLAWQVGLINEYKKPGQFVTQNFDLEWRGYSFGIQPDVDHFAAAQAFDIAGVDIYHPTQNQLTGTEISFGGDLARSLKRSNYLVLETQAQGFPHWLPYPGQLRLQAMSHVAAGASMVAYWHFHSIHNSFETYWKGLLSQDLLPNPTYREAQTIGRDFARLGDRLLNLTIQNDVAILVSNQAYAALEAFKLFQGISYNDEVRRYYDALYRQNVGCDLIHPDSPELESYRLVIVPALYAAPDALLDRLNRYVESGGHVIYGLRSGFANDDVQVRAELQPGRIREVCGVSYSQFTVADGVRIVLTNAGTNTDADTGAGAASLTDADRQLAGFMELLTPDGAEVWARYEHPVWGSYAAITQHCFGEGRAIYVGCQPSPTVCEKLVRDVAATAGLLSSDQDLHFPLITKKGVNPRGEMVRFYFNYSPEPISVCHAAADAQSLFAGTVVHAGSTLELAPWGVEILVS